MRSGDFATSLLTTASTFAPYSVLGTLLGLEMLFGPEILLELLGPGLLFEILLGPGILRGTGVSSEILPDLEILLGPGILLASGVLVSDILLGPELP